DRARSGSGRCRMRSTRGMIAGVLVAVILVTTLSPALAQQPTQPAAPPQPPPPVLMPDVVKEEGTVRPFDMYSVAAGISTVSRFPGNVALCAFGAALGTTVFLLTLGSAYRGTTRIVEEGCGGKWVLRGDDIRPIRGSPGIFESRMDRYQER